MNNDKTLSGRTAIIYAHPDEKSFNHAILSAVIDRLNAEKKGFDLIDLYHDKFNPVFTVEDLNSYVGGHIPDPLVRRYQQILSRADNVIFIFPVWWYEMPAILKGFFDRVMTPGFAYSFDHGGAMLPGLRISRTLVVTTSGGDSAPLANYFEGHFIPMVLESVGFSGCEWCNCPDTGDDDRTRREKFIEDLLSRI